MQNHFSEKKRNKYVLALFLGLYIVLAFFSVLILYHRSSNLLNAWESRNWIETPATVLKNKIENTGTGRRVQARYDILCQYHYQGKNYKTSEFGYGASKESLYEKANSGSKFNVYVNPKAPSQAYMSRGTSVMIWLTVPIWTALLFYFLYKIREIFQNLRSQPRPCRSTPGTRRSCKWDHYASNLDMIPGMLQNRENTCIVNNTEDEMDSLHIRLLEDNTYTITTGMTTDWSILRTSPPFGYHEMLDFLDKYEDGLLLAVFAKDWEERESYPYSSKE